MAPKRQNESQSTDELSGRERKKQKTAIARTIAVQQDAGPSTPGTAPEAGPSKSVRFDSEFPSVWPWRWTHMGCCGGMKGLPGAMDVERFAEVSVLRSWEISGSSSVVF